MYQSYLHVRQTILFANCLHPASPQYNHNNKYENIKTNDSMRKSNMLIDSADTKALEYTYNDTQNGTRCTHVFKYIIQFICYTTNKDDRNAS